MERRKSNRGGNNAVIEGERDFIVTFNLKDYPDASLEAYDVSVQHLGDFDRHFFESHPVAAVPSVRIVRARLRHPPCSGGEYGNPPRRHGLHGQSVNFEHSRK